jgi:hypothetical protein
MQHLFVKPEIALKLKEKGFKEQCLAVYQTQENNKLVIQYFSKQSLEFAPHLLPTPLYQQVIDWLRIKNIKIVEMPMTNTNNTKNWLIISEKTLNKKLGFLTLDDAIDISINLL